MKHLFRFHWLTCTAILLALLLAPVDLLAQKPIKLLECLPGDVCEISASGPHPLSMLNDYLRPFMPWLMGVAAGLAVLMIIVGGFQIMLSGGDQGGQSAGKDRVKAAIAGLLILVFSATILNMLNAYYFRLGGSAGP